MTYDEMLESARDISMEIVSDLADIANDLEPKNIRVFAGLTASLVFQTMLVTFAVDEFEPGSMEGIDWFTKVYHEALAEVIERWQKSDLRNFTKKH